MCGIFGAIARGEAPLRHPEALARMAAALSHRGPGGECIVGHERARMGARRLATSDLTTADRPFRTPAGNIGLVGNGGVNHAPALRPEPGRWGPPRPAHG